MIPNQNHLMIMVSQINIQIWDLSSHGF